MADASRRCAPIWRSGGANNRCSSSPPRRAATTVTSTSRPRATTRSACSAPTACAYLDLTGSGVETIAHLRDNGRITLMACAFSGNPRISRIYGRGTVHPSARPSSTRSRPSSPTAARAAGRSSRVAVERVTTSCGYSVPLMDLVDDRDRLLEWATRPRATTASSTYWDAKNTREHRRPAGDANA